MSVRCGKGLVVMVGVGQSIKMMLYDVVSVNSEVWKLEGGLD